MVDHNLNKEKLFKYARMCESADNTVMQISSEVLKH